MTSDTAPDGNRNEDVDASGALESADGSDGTAIVNESSRTGADREGENASGERGDRRSVPARLADGLERVRTEPAAHVIALVTAAALGLALSWLHWLGLVVAGALVGLVSPSVPRALLGGLGVGLLVLVAFAATLGEAAAVAAGMTPIVSVAVAAAIGLPLLGSLSRAVV